MKRKYVKWILGLDRRTPNYNLVEETKMKELGQAARKRGIRFEEIARHQGKKLVLECLREMDRGGIGKKISKWEEKRKKERRRQK